MRLCPICELPDRSDIEAYRDRPDFSYVFVAAVLTRMGTFDGTARSRTTRGL